MDNAVEEDDPLFIVSVTEYTSRENAVIGNHIYGI